MKFISLLAWLCFGWLAVPCWAQVASVQSADGQAAIDGAAAVAGEAVLPGVVLSTGPVGGIRIGFDDGSRLGLGPGARLKVVRLERAAAAGELASRMGGERYGVAAGPAQPPLAFAARLEFGVVCLRLGKEGARLPFRIFLEGADVLLEQGVACLGAEGVALEEGRAMVRTKEGARSFSGLESLSLGATTVRLPTARQILAEPPVASVEQAPVRLGGWKVVALSVPERDKADIAAQALKKGGLSPVEVVPAMVGGVRYYRVAVAGAADRAAAEGAARRAGALLGTKPWLLPPAAGGGEPGVQAWQVVAASWPDKVRAQAAVGALKKHGYRPAMLQLPYRGKTWFRVVLSGYGSRAAAADVAAKVGPLLGYPSRVIPAGAPGSGESGR